MDLVILAAGMGSRFGGLKQIQPIDDKGNFIVDYSIYDAIRAGFDRVIFIIKKENYNDFAETIGKRLEGKVKVEYVFQELDNVPSGVVIPKERTKPWGTAHALYCCKDVVSDRFAVINADDFYGVESFEILANFLKSEDSAKEFLNVGYHIENTLSEKGSVKRGVLKTDGGYVQNLEESVVEKIGGKVYATPLLGGETRDATNLLVSLNMFGFNEKLMNKIKLECVKFFEDKNNLEAGEFLLPAVVNDMLAGGEISVKVLETPSKWYGITYKDDLEDFKSAIKKKKDNGEYADI